MDGLKEIIYLVSFCDRRQCDRMIVDSSTTSYFATEAEIKERLR
jgi:hypothetical protein